MDNAFDGDIVSTRPAHAFSPSCLSHLENPPTSAIDLDHTTAVSDGISLMTDPPFIGREQRGHYDSAAEGHPMGFSGVPVVPPHGYTRGGLVDIRGGNQVFDYGSFIPRVREPSFSQVTIEDYDEQFGTVPPTFPYSSTHGNEFQTAHPTGMQEAYISSYSSLAGWNGVSNSTVAVSGSMTTNLASLENPGSSDAAPAFSTPGRSLSLASNPAYVHQFLAQQTPHWPAALPWVDGEQRSSSANPQSYNLGPELSAGGDGLPVRGHGSPGNQRIGGNSPAEVASIFPHGLPPTSSSSLQSFPTQGRISPHPSKIPCPYGPKYSTPVPCYRSTYLRSPFKHWMVHIRDQLWAIRRWRLKLRDASIINTHKKHKSAQKYLSDFCPACNESFLTSREVRNHMMSSPQCSQFFCCKDCGTGAGRQEGCAECAHLKSLIIRTYVQLCKEIGYSHPEHPDLSESDNERAAEMAVQSGVEQDLKNREVKRGQKGDVYQTQSSLVVMIDERLDLNRANIDLCSFQEQKHLSNTWELLTQHRSGVGEAANYCKVS
ncbi:hypothetical protein BU17DRAFT_63051 [Hysterangium stoloniferum]|nr:hypothetical protein BU17DRAFT_63051 [Hysterangium stoloniferum]